MMNNFAGDSQNRRHSLTDWLTLHELDPATCGRILRATTRELSDEPAAHNKVTSVYEAPDVEGAWLRTAESMRVFLPSQRNIIDDTFDNTVKIVVDQRENSPRGLTLDNGPTAYPTILFSYRSEPSDFLVIAHEFGHALQIRASRGKFVPPVMREVCAFLGEGALLSHILQCSPAQHTHLVQVWRERNNRYFGPQSERLKAALARPDAPYKYTWNYPIARYLAIQISKQCSREWIWSVFEGETSLSAVLRKLSFSPG